jgi:transcriptional regulator with XRE-family HTH domain
MVIETSIGNYLQNLRKERKMSLRDVADHIGIDISMLSKIEHGERQLQTHMLKDLCEIFEIDYKMMQIQLLNQKIENEYGSEPFILESIEQYLNIKRNK